MSWLYCSALLIGMLLGAFLVLGGAYILKKAFAVMTQAQTRFQAGQVIGLASLWISKILVVCLALYWLFSLGFPADALGLGLPVGIVLTVLLFRKGNA